MNTDNLIDEAIKAGTKLYKKACQVRIFRSEEPDKDGWWCADLTFNEADDDCCLGYSAEYGEWDTLDCAIADLAEQINDRINKNVQNGDGDEADS